MTPKRFLPFCVAAVLAAVLCALYGVGFAVAHADPAGSVVTVGATDIIQSLIGYAVLVLAIGYSFNAVVGAVAKLIHAIAARTTTTRDDGWAADADGLHDKLDQALGFLRDLLPGGSTSGPAGAPVSVTVTNHAAPGDAPATIKTAGPVAALMAVLLIGAVAMQPACGARERVTVGVAAGLDCEQGNLAAIAKEGLALGTAALLSTISGAGHPDTAAIKAAFGSAQSDSLRCLTAAAFAALLSPAPAKPSAPAAAPLEVDAGELRAAFAGLRAGWGVAGVKVNGLVI